MTPETHSGSVYAGYNQFYLFDADRPGDTAAPTFFSEEAFSSRLPIGTGVVGVMTSSYSHVPVVLETALAEPQFNSSQWAYVIEGPLSVSRGRIQIVGCPDAPTDLIAHVPPGDYIVRVCFSKIVEDGSDVEWNGDKYLLQVYPGTISGRRVIKARE